MFNKILKLLSLLVLAFFSSILSTVNLYAQPSPRIELLHCFGCGVTHEHMLIKSHERERFWDQSSPVIWNPTTTSFGPDDIINHIPEIEPGQKWIWAIVEDRSNRLGLTLRIALEDPNIEPYKSPSGEWKRGAWGHPTIIRPGESALLAGNLCADASSGTVTLDNLSGRISASPYAGAAGGGVAQRFLQHLLRNSIYKNVTFKFKNVLYGAKSNFGAKTHIPYDLINSAFVRALSGPSGTAARIGSGIILPEGVSDSVDTALDLMDDGQGPVILTTTSYALLRARLLARQGLLKTAAFGQRAAPVLGKASIPISLGALSAYSFYNTAIAHSKSPRGWTHRYRLPGQSRGIMDGRSVSTIACHAQYLKDPLERSSGYSDILKLRNSPTQQNNTIRHILR